MSLAARGKSLSKAADRDRDRYQGRVRNRQARPATVSLVRHWLWQIAVADSWGETLSLLCLKLRSARVAVREGCGP